MLQSLSNPTIKTSVLRRAAFGVRYLPKDFPNYWQTLMDFSYKEHHSSAIAIGDFRMCVENLQEMDAAVFQTDDHLLQELIACKDQKGRPLGLILISHNNTCLLCNSKLLVRKDRPSPVIVYDDNLGSLHGSHYHKYCQNRSCSFTQYYGYYTLQRNGSTTVLYNSDWDSLDYFVSSRETVFSMTVLLKCKAEILIGQLSFKQCADLYNYIHKYGTGDNARYVNMKT